MVDLARTLVAENFETRQKEGKKPYITTGNITIPNLMLPVPGQDGKIGRANITFCVTFTGIKDAAEHAAKAADTADNALAALPEEARNRLLEKYMGVNA